MPLNPSSTSRNKSKFNQDEHQPAFESLESLDSLEGLIKNSFDALSLYIRRTLTHTNLAVASLSLSLTASNVSKCASFPDLEFFSEGHTAIRDLSPSPNRNALRITF